MVERTKADIQIWHRREPTFRESRGRVHLDDFDLMAELQLRLPAVAGERDAHRFAAGAYRLTQAGDLTSHRLLSGRSTHIGDLIFVRIDGCKQRVLECVDGGFKPIEVVVGATKERRAA